jgi:hypothetical protein
MVNAVPEQDAALAPLISDRIAHCERILSRLQGFPSPTARQTALHRRISRQLQLERGKYDRLTGRPCRSADGAYLNGWYYEQSGDVLAWYYATTRDLLDAERESCQA